jgi:hypothetical protein
MTTAQRTKVVEQPSEPTYPNLKLRLLIGSIIFVLGSLAIGILASDLGTAIILGLLNGAFFSHFVFRR